MYATDRRAGHACDDTAGARAHGPSRAAARRGSGLAALGLSVLVALAAVAARAQVPSPHAIDVPPWFAQSFLDLREDLRDAAKEGKRLMIYFGQDGCPYCRQLLVTNFSRRDIVEKARRHFVAIDINLWGDREVTWLDGRTRSEKDFAAHLKVQFTPTLLFLDERGETVVRLNGYYPPARLSAVLDYVAGRKEREIAFGDWMRTAVRESANPKLNEQPFFVPAPLDLTRRPGAKPLAVLFETPHCPACDEMHRDAFPRPEMREQIAKADVARIALGSTAELVAPDGRRLGGDAWARELGIAYTPSVVFFEATGREVFRIDAYLRPFHLISSFDYVTSGAYRKEPSFQRFLQARADRARARGQAVDLLQ